MFWRFGGYANISSIDTILDKPDVTLEELLDESDLIQELKQQNPKLIEFLREEPILHKLLRYVIADQTPQIANSSSFEDTEEKSTGISFFGKGKPKSRSRSKSVRKSFDHDEADEDKNEARRKKYAYVACEILSSDVWSIVEALVEYDHHLREFWEYMKRPAPPDALQAGYFTKVNEALFEKKTEEMLVFFKSLDNIIPLMLQHVECPMIMDLLLKIVTLEKHDGGQGVVDWLQSQDLIPTLLSYLSLEHSLATQTAAGDFLKAIITISANATTQDQTVIGPNELTRQLVSEPCIGTLIRDMLQGGNPLTVGVGIVIEVIRKNNSDYDLDNQVGPDPKTSDPIYLGTLLRQFAHHVPDFMHLIRSKSAKKPDLKAAFGAKIEPLGFDRFKTCELMAELLHCSNMGLLNERGAEAEVRQRDLDRERLKAEGKLSVEENRSSLPEEEYPGSSVDSHGFHHAERPEDDLSGSPEEIKRLEVQNATDEDGYEKVGVPDNDTLPDEVSFDDFNEKMEESSIPSPSEAAQETAEGERSGTPIAGNRQHDGLLEAGQPSPSTPSGVHEQVSELRLSSPEESSDEPQSEGKHRVSLLTQQLQQQIQESELNQVSDSSTAPEGSEQDVDMLSHPEDKPAPLFTSKISSSQDEDEADSPSQSTATLQPDGSHPTTTAEEQHVWEADLDGSPVVGDLLKIMFVEHQVVPTILDFFFRFPWNNFLHNVVYDVVQQVFNGSFERGYNRILAVDLFCQSRNLELVSRADVTQRILDGQAASDKSQQEKGMRLGYMGHLTLIAEEVLKLHDRQPPELLGDEILERIGREDWVHYLEGILSDTRDRDNAVLGGVKPENAMNVRQVGLGGGMLGQGGNSSALADAGLSGVPSDSMALQESGDGSGYNIGGESAGLLGGFGNGDDDEDMDGNLEGERREKAVSDDEQVSTSPVHVAGAPLNVPPSRARRQLAMRLAARKKEAEDAESVDPDLEDPLALDAASELSPDRLFDSSDLLNESDMDDVGPRVSGIGLRGTTGIADRTTDTLSRFVDNFDSSSSSSSSLGSGSESEGDPEGTHIEVAPAEGLGEASEEAQSHGDGGLRRRPSTTEAKFRIPLDDEDVDQTFLLSPTESSNPRAGGSEAARNALRQERGRIQAESPFADHMDSSDGSDESEDSDEGDIVEIKPRRRD